MKNLARFGVTASVDATFIPGSGPNGILGPNGVVRSIVTQPDGKILVAGDFSAYADRPCAGVARIQTNGVFDATFHPAAGLGLAHPRLTLQSDGAVLVGGASTTGRPLVRLLGGNAPDATPVVSIQPATTRVTTGESVTLQAYAASRTPCTYQWLHDGTTITKATNAILVLTNATVALGGTYSVSVGNALGTTRSEALVEVIALSSRVGRLDTTYNAATRSQVMDGFFALALEPGGGAILGGGFRSFNGAPGTNLVRVDGMGNVDTNFNTGSMAAGTYPDWVQALARQPDGRLLCGGRFSRHLLRMKVE